MSTEPNDAPEGVADPIDAVLDEARTDTQSGADAAAETVEGAEGVGDTVQPKPKPTAQERIDEVTKARREAERERDYWREEALKKAKPADQPDPAPQPKADEAPDPANYPYGEADTGYIRDLVNHGVKQGIAQFTQQQAVHTQAQTIEQTWADRQAEFKKTTPDYEAVIDRKWVCSPIMADAIKTSEEGAAVAYHLASNPDEARRIAALAPLAQVRELGRIEATLAKPATAPVKTVSTAPDPAPQVRGAGGKFKAAPDTDDFASFDAAY